MTRKREIRRLRGKVGQGKVPPEWRGNPSVDPDAEPREPGELEATFDQHIHRRQHETGEGYEAAKAGLLDEYRRELNNVPSGLDML